MANVANKSLMRLIREMVRSPPEGVTLARINEDGSFTFIRRIPRSQLKDCPIVWINRDMDDTLGLELGVCIDIRSFIYDENIPGFNDQFAFRGTTFPRTRGFRDYPQTCQVINQIFTEGVMRDRHQYLDTFHARLQLLNGDVFYWLNTTPRPVQDYFFEERDSVIYDWMMPDSEFFLPEKDLKAGTPYRTEDPYPFGYVSARVRIPPEHLQRPPEIRFINPIFHPNIFPNGRVDPRVYAENWRSEQSVQNMLNLILRILREPDLNNRVDDVGAVHWLDNQRENTEPNISMVEKVILEIIDLN